MPVKGGAGKWPAKRKFAVAVNAERLAGRYNPPGKSGKRKKRAKRRKSK